MRATGVVITADSAQWARQAAVTMTGFATSVIGCGCEAGIDRELKPSETPDGRPGVRVLLFAVSTSELQKQLQNRVGQCVLTSPGSACYAGLDGAEQLNLGNALRYFGDGWQISKRFGAKHYWRIPVMDGEFVCEATTGLTKEAVGGGNLLIMAATTRTALAAAEAAAAAIERVPDVIAPFPGGIVRSGSKVGSKYKSVRASTNDAYCPTLRGAVNTALDADSRLGAGDRDRRPHAGCGGGRDARRARSDREARAEARRATRRRRQLRRQARAASLPPAGTRAMKPLVLTLRARPEQRLDLSPLVPHRLAGLSAAEIARIALQTTRTTRNGRRRVSPAHGRCRATSASRAPATGSTGSAQSMTGGEIVVDGDVGVAGRPPDDGRAARRSAGMPARGRPPACAAARSSIAGNAERAARRSA